MKKKVNKKNTVAKKAVAKKSVSPNKKVAKKSAPKKVTKKVSVKATKKVVTNADHRKQRGRTAPNRALSVTRSVEVKKTTDLDFTPTFLKDLAVPEKSCKPTDIKTTVTPVAHEPSTQLSTISQANMTMSFGSDPWAGCRPVSPM